MTATQNVSQFSPNNNCPVPRHGVLTLFGYKIQVRVDRGHLYIQDGVGVERREFRLPRVGHGLSRLVVIGADGAISFSAFRWLSDQNVAFSMLERSGKVFAVTGPVRPSDAKLRRAQALALGSEVGLKIARELISRKLGGQEQAARYILRDSSVAEQIARFRAALRDAEQLDAIRFLESQAAVVYWAAWRSVPAMFPAKDLPRVPEHWRTFGTRKSLLSGSPRLAVNPPNAMLNYLYAVLESECRLAAAALGLDPGLGVLHMDTSARDSLACDLMESVRPQVDRYLLSWILSHPLRREWFFEERSGNCRLMTSLTLRLSETAPTWGRAIAPVAEWVAQELWTSTRKRASKPNLLPTRLTQRRRTEGRGREFAPPSATAPDLERVCRACGASAPHGERCANCARDVARENMIKFAKSGRVAAQSADAQRKRSETQLRHKAAQRKWCSEPKSERISEDVYKNEIQPRLAPVTISAIASQLGVSISYAAEIRAGRRRPHARHWKALAGFSDIPTVNS